jgi:hypothetical protein
MPGTGLLTQRCDPYGIESGSVKLAGGLFPENMMGRYVWYCTERAEGRFRYVCTGGDYGFRRANDAGIVNAYHCDGGHKGQVMTLCRKHQRDLTIGPPEPGWHSDLKTPYGQIGGTKSNEMCPACTVARGTAWDQEVRGRMDTANELQSRLSALMSMPVALIPQITELERLLNVERGHLSELHERGIIHKCPLKLVEVS